MITDILPYVLSYAEIRAVTGLNKQELPDSDIKLMVYTNQLGQELEATTGEYPVDYGTVENLEEIYDRIETGDSMHSAIQVYSVYVVADRILDAVGLRAYKTIADGKANLTRFSPESAYQDTRRAIKDAINRSLAYINELLGKTTTQRDFVTVVPPAVDLVTGA